MVSSAAMKLGSRCIHRETVSRATLAFLAAAVTVGLPASAATTRACAGVIHSETVTFCDESEDQLIAEVCAEATQELMEGMENLPTIGAEVAGCLSTRHRDTPASGCPLSAIGSELGRTDEKTRVVATDALERLVGLLVGNSNEKDARRRVLVAASTMIGAVTMSRVVNNLRRSAEILREARKSLMAARS
jgi:TetR/AcrR family transcriptional repressor of nem operon